MEYRNNGHIKQRRNNVATGILVSVYPFALVWKTIILCFFFNFEINFKNSGFGGQMG